MTKVKFLNFEEAEAETGIPVWKLRKWTWGDESPALVPPDGPRARTYIKRDELLALMEFSRKA